MKYKMIALDIDDTLLNHQKIITPLTKRTLINAQEQGIKVVIASGRMSYGVRPYVKELKLESYGGFYMCFNGGLVFDSRHKVISKAYLDRKFLKPVCEIIKSTNIAPIVHRGDNLYSNGTVNEYTRVETEAIGLPINAVDDFVSFVDWDIHKILLAGEPTELKKFEKPIKDAVSGEADVYFSAPWFLEVMPKEADKGKGLESICHRCGIAPSQVIACGDSYNDIPMIKTAGLGVSMANGVRELKEAADYVTHNDCDRDGAAEVLLWLLREEGNGL